MKTQAPAPVFNRRETLAAQDRLRSTCREETERQPGAGGCHRRAGAWRRHRLDRTVEAHWRSRAPSLPNPTWLNAPRSQASAARWNSPNRTVLLPPHTTASRLSLPPAQPWGGDILQPVPRVPCRPESHPMSRSPEIAAAAAAAAARYHPAWSFGGG